MCICAICNNPTDNPVYEAKEMMFGFRDTFEYFQCSKCEPEFVTKEKKNLYIQHKTCFNLYIHRQL